MPTVIGHAAVAIAANEIFLKQKLHSRFGALSLFASILPDFDVLGFGWGIRYESFFGHRGFTHSFFFAALASAGIVILFFREASQKTAFYIYFFLLTASHGLLDAFTDGGLGIAFFSPFSNARYFFPWRPLLVSPIGIDFFSDYGMKVLANEAICVTIPCMLLFLFSKLLRWK